MNISKEEVVNMIDDYLSGRINKKEISNKAIKIITNECFGVDEMLIEDALTALSGLHDQDERWDTAKEDLIFFKDCLQGKRPYLAKVEFLPFPQVVAK